MFKLICAVALLAVSTAQADTIYVDADCPGGDGSEQNPYCSIQTAIDNAVDTDEIVVAPGTYFETINFLGKAVTLRSSDGADVTIIDGTGFFHVVQCVSGEGPDTVLHGFRITGGNANGSFPDNFGGGMFIDNGSPTVANCWFIGNTASGGGGMANEVSSPTVTNCIFSGNIGSGGGGMSNRGHSSPTVTNCTFSGNASVIGGGLLNYFNSSPTVIGCVFSNNIADFLNGSQGGGMYNEGSDPTVIGCTFRANSTGGGFAAAGGGVFNDDSNPTITNCTFILNLVGGIFSYNSCPTVTNSILWNNLGYQILDYDSSAASTVNFSNVQSGWPGAGSNNIDADPLFVAENSDFRLSPGSPCIDAGDNTAVPEDITTDLDGNPRFVDDPDTADTGFGDPPIVDMGAYEYQGIPCPWDLDSDGNVFVMDLLLLLMDFGICDGSPADFDGDGCVTVVDLLTLMFNFGPCPDGGCPWDVNGDGTVDKADLWQVLGNQGPCDGCAEDVNGDGVVNGQDAAAVATHFGACP